MNETPSASPKANGNHMLAIYEHAPVGIVECSSEGRLTNANEEYCRITGYQKDELLIRSIKDITYEEDYAE